MRIFLSHSSKDKEMALLVADFLESLNVEIKVFCTSQQNSIRAGRDFVNAITNELKASDIFIPLLSTDYYKSRFCMIELGFAYGILSAINSDETEYIYPLSIYPITESEALSNTPLSRLTCVSINNIDAFSSYLRQLLEQLKSSNVLSLNNKIDDFVYDINKILFSKYDVKSNAKILLCKGGNVPGHDNEYLNYSLSSEGEGYIVNFKAKPYVDVYPDFLSFVFKYIDKINLFETANIFKDSSLNITIDNYTNSLNKICVEIKYSDNNLMLHRQEVYIADGLNKLVINLEEIKSEALKSVSEICLVMLPNGFIKAEGMFRITEFRLSHS